MTVLRKDIDTRITPEVQAQAAQPYQPPRAAWTEVRNVRVCELVTTPTGGQAAGVVRVVSYEDGKAVVRWEYQQAVAPTFVTTRVCRDVPTTIYHPAEPERPAQASVTYQPPGVVQNFRLGWNSGARSIDFIPASGYAEFKLQGVGAVVGFSAQPDGTLWTDIEHAFYATRRTLKIVERGAEKFAAGSFEPSDVLRIERIGTRVEYRRNGDLLYTSQSPSLRPVYLDASLYAGGDSVSGAVLQNTDKSAGNIVAAMRPPAGMLSDRAYAVFRNEIAAPVGMLSAVRSRIVATMRPMETLWGDRPVARFRASLRPLAGRLATGLPAPAYALFSAQMYPLQTVMHILSGGLFRAHNAMAPPATLWADRPYAAFHGEMCPPLSALFDSGWTQPPQRLPRPGLALASGTQIQMTAPRALLRIEAQDVPNRLDLVMPAALLRMDTGARVGMVAPAGELNLQANVSAVARIELTSPPPTMSLEAVADILAEIALKAPAARAGVVGGAQAAMVSPAALMSAESTTETVAQIRMTGPVPRLALEALGEATAQVAVQAPAMRATGWVDAVLRMPLASMTLDAAVVVPVVLDAYAVNLRTTLEVGGNEVTRYTNFPFRRIVRWRGQYVALADDGLYVLGGDLDAGQPIAWAVHTGTTDFKSPQRKTPISCYVGGRLPPASVFSVAAGEKCETRYPYCTPRGDTAQNYRQKFGRGLDARYYAFELSGVGDMTIDQLEFDIATKTRRI